MEPDAPIKDEEPDAIVCIYCKETKPASREHILPASLGGDLVQPILCVDCNSRRLSPIDQALAERSLVALSRVAFTPKGSFDVKLGGEHFTRDPESGLVFDLKLSNAMQAELLPQVHVVKSLERPEQPGVAFATKDVADFERLAAFVEQDLAAKKLRSMYVKTGPEEAGPTARLVMHREKDGYVRAPSAEDADLLFRVIDSGWHVLVNDRRGRLTSSGPIQPSEIKNPSVHSTVKIRFDDVYRGVAKIAFNFAAVHLGTRFMLGHEFDEVRRYILGDDIRHPEAVKPGDVAVDTRFVTQLPAGTDAVVHTEEHAVTLFYNAPVLLAWVTLYKTHHFVVRLADIHLTENVLAVQEFSSVRRGNAALDVAQIVERLRR